MYMTLGIAEGTGSSFRTRFAGLKAEVGGWKNKEEARQCVMHSEEDEESVEHVLMRCTAYTCRSDGSRM